MAMTEEMRAKFEAGLAEQSDAEIRLKIDTNVYGGKGGWKQSLAKQELERRKDDNELSMLRRENASYGAAVVMALKGRPIK